MNKKGLIFDIQRFCIHDGPGIRTTVFLKGCPLKCIWCHNPESQSFKRQLSIDFSKCFNCKRCMEVCENRIHSFENHIHKVDFDKCKLCGKCEKVCKNNAISILGKEYSIEETINIVEKDIKFYKKSNGGVTFSGGEAIYQLDFLIETYKILKEKDINICLETSGYIEKDKLKKINRYVDLYLYDYKATGEEKHKKLTSVSNKKILNNLIYLNDSNKKIILRCPLVPQVNDDKDHLKMISHLSLLKNVLKVEILPYHNLGKSKSKKIGKKYILDDMKTVNYKKAQQWKKEIEKLGGKNIWISN